MCNKEADEKRKPVIWGRSSGYDRSYDTSASTKWTIVANWFLLGPAVDPPHWPPNGSALNGSFWSRNTPIIEAVSPLPLTHKPAEKIRRWSPSLNMFQGQKDRRGSFANARLGRQLQRWREEEEKAKNVIRDSLRMRGPFLRPLFLILSQF